MTREKVLDSFRSDVENASANGQYLKKVLFKGTEYYITS